MKQKIWSLLLALTLAVSLFPIRAQAKNVNGTYYTVNGVTVPLANWPAGGKSYGKNQCWAFAQMVYKKLWGTGFTSYRNTNDDLLRKIGTGDDRAITAANTKRFITAAKPGAVIRMTDNISGADNKGTRMHSIILVQKDENGFTNYDSTSGGVRLRYFTWAEFADKCKCYKYFKYIKFPNAPALQSSAKPDSVTLAANKTSCPAGEVVTFTANANNASHFVLYVQKNGNTVYTSPNFSTSTTWSPSSGGTYTATVSAFNGNGSTSGQSVTVSAYDSAPSAPTTVLSTETPIYGQNVTISWYGSTNVKSYSYQILKDGVVYRSGSTPGSDSYTSTFPEGSYTVKVTAINPFGSTSSTKRFVVSGCTASGTCGDHITWRLNTKEGLLILSGYGEMYDGRGPWIDYKNSITKVDMDDRITRIGRLAFFEHTQLQYIHFPDQLIEIGGNAFTRCANLVGDMYQHKGEYLCYNDRICLPHSLKLVDTWAFNYCTSLKEVYFNAKPDQTAITFGCAAGEATPRPFDGCSPDLQVVNAGGISYDDVTHKALNPMGYSWWGSWNWFQVYFDVNGGAPFQGSNQVENSYGSTYKIIAEVPVREGYTFLGWYTAPEGGTQVTTDTPVNRLHSHTLFAHWRANEYTVTLAAEDAESGSARLFSAQDTITVGYWENYGEMPTPTMEGYTFTGWSTSPDGGEIITEDSIYTMSKDQTLYATWEPIASDYDTPGSSGWEGIHYDAERDYATVTSMLDYDRCAVMRVCYNSQGKMLDFNSCFVPLVAGDNMVFFGRVPPAATATIKVIVIDSDTMAPLFEADVE